MKHDLEIVREDLLELSGLFRRVCANSRDPGPASMRSMYRRIGSMLLAGLDKGVLSADERKAILLALERLRQKRLVLDDDLSQTRFRLDARLVMLERHVKQALDLDTESAVSIAQGGQYEFHDPF